MAGRTNDTRRYYNSKTIDEALTVLQGHWPNRTRSKKDARQQGRKKSRVISPLWIEDDLGGRVGVKVMVLVTHLIYRYVSTESLKISKLSVVNDGPDFDAKTLSDGGFKGSSQSFRKTLSPLASENNLSKKDYDHRRDKLAFCCFAFKAKRAIDRLEGSEPDEAVTIAQANDLYDKIVSARCDTAQEVFRIIEASWLQGLQYLEPEEENDDDEPAEHTDTSGLHSIPDKLAHYLPPNGKFQKNRNPSEIIDIAERILQQFDTVKERLALIYGKVNAGKSGCVVELLRSLCDRDSETISLSLKPSETDQAVPLPVFTVSVQDHTGYEMLLLVLAFLERCGQTPKQRKEFDFKKRVKDLASDYGDEMDPGAVDKVKAKIRELHHDQPVLFILTNWEDLTWSTPRAQLRDQSKTSLISLLHDSNTLSRFVITTTTTPNRRAKRGLPKYRQFEVKDPRLQHINRYLPNLKIPPCYENALFEAVERLDGAAVPGDHLILIASALELCRDTQQWEQRAIEALGELEAENYRGPVVVAPHQFVKLLVERLDNLDLFRIVMAIMASEDGLRPSSLRRLMRDWDHDAGRKLNRVGDAVDKGLKYVEGLANTFFLRKRNINPINVTQFSPLEKQMAEEESWEIYETLRQTILTALTDPSQQDWAAPYSLLLREATRHVAKLAFDRAQEWRARTVYANLTPWWQDLLLDIQALEALLASVDPEKLENKKTNQDQKWAFPLLHHATDVIFTCRDTHAPAVAVRFAILTLLIDTVDVDNRMSMCYDQDLMRMRLYMLPFLGVGQRHFERLDDKTLEDLPKSIPGWMRGVFSDEEILRLLEAVAISALHSQAADVVRWAWERTSDVIDAAVADGANRQDLIKRTTRTYCSTIDMGIQRGSPLDDKKGSNPGRVGHERTLDQLDIFIEQTFPNFKETEAVAAQEQSLMDPDMIEAIGRLRVRRAHLLGLLGKLAEAEEEFSAIHAWEIALARASGSGRPEILEGRPARVAMQIMMRGELMLQHQPERRKDIARRLRGMLSANNARLARFGGAEQAAVLVDRSRFAFVNGDPDLAYEYAAEARQFCDDNRVSYGMQIHILLNLVAILIECSETTRAKESKDKLLNRSTIDLAERDADAVYHTAKALTLRPTEGVALYLRARLQHLRNVLYPDVHPNAGRPDSSKKDIGEAILIMQKCADQSFRQGMEHLRNEICPTVAA